MDARGHVMHRSHGVTKTKAFEEMSTSNAFDPIESSPVAVLSTSEKRHSFASKGQSLFAPSTPGKRNDRRRKRWKDNPVVLAEVHKI